MQCIFRVCRAIGSCCHVKVSKCAFVKCRKDASGGNLPEKRVRKQVIHKDFVNTSTFKKIKLRESSMMDDEGACSTSSTENTPIKGNGGTPFKSNSSPGSGQYPEFPCPICRKIFRKKGHMTRCAFTEFGMF